MNGCAIQTAVALPFQCSSASRKFLNQRRTLVHMRSQQVSVLFSEPKIPQFSDVPASAALLNEFQCSSASRKFLNAARRRLVRRRERCFSALQRAENSSMKVKGSIIDLSACFSALQRAENSSMGRAVRVVSHRRRFSALQRAENSSM